MRKAIVIDKRRTFSTYAKFAVRHGYPDAASGKLPENGEEVTLLVSGEHDWMLRSGTLWIVENAKGQRFIIGEKGLRILDENVTVLADEELGGVKREYREVKREARKGERIKALGHGYGFFREGDIGVVTALFGGGVVLANFRTGKWCVGYNEPGYVVLEPTDIIHVDGGRYRMEERKANVGERVIVISPEENATYDYQKGSILRVDCNWTSGDGVRCGLNSLYHREYRVLIPVKTADPTPLSEKSPTDQQAEIIANLTARLAEAERKIERLTSDVRIAREDVVLLEEGLAKEIDDLKRKVNGKSADIVITRDEVVEKAKADVADLKERMGSWNLNNEGNETFRNTVSVVEFIVNREKRTVVALVKGSVSDKIYEKGIAKCAPGDVFNAHIGRAIALRRALGLDVPEEYKNVPQPTEPRVGDIVLVTEPGAITGKSMTLTKRDPYFDGLKGMAFRHTHDFGWLGSEQFRIIDDSREEGVE